MEDASSPFVPPDPRADPSLALSLLQSVDVLCEQFERSLQAGDSVTIESYLAQASPEERTLLLRELLALELEYRLRRQENPTESEYRARFPDDGAIVELAFRESEESIPQAIPRFLQDHPRYHVLRWVGAGGMGRVYAAEHRVLRRTVALKIVHPQWLADAEAAERFVREARSAACLNHPNVVAVYDAETAGQGHFLVMEYVAGTDLAQLVLREGPLKVPRACEFIRQAALGLQHAHEHGMVHRDITPRNLMLTNQEQIKVLDFGLAYFASEMRSADRPTGTEVLLGSVDSMAPEQANDPQAADIRADIYSLGCALYFLLAGEPPFPAGTLEEKLRAHALRTPPSLDTVRDDIPPELLAVLDRMLAKSPADRYATPAEVAAALEPFAGAARVGRSTASLRLAGVSLRGWIAVLAAVLLVGVPLAAWQFGVRDGDRRSSEAAPQSPEAYRLYREGLLLLGRRQESQMDLAITKLADAVETDPRYAPAWTALANAYNLCVDYGWAMADDMLPKAKTAARQALAIDDRLAEAHLALALALDVHDADWQQAEAEYRRALEVNAELPAAHQWYAWFLVRQGRMDEAAREIDLAQQLGSDEVIIANSAGRIQYLRRHYDSAIEKHRYALELNPDFRTAHRDMAFAYAEQGRLRKAMDELDRAKGLTEDGRDLQSIRAYVLARNGHAEEARLLIVQLESLADKKPIAYDIAAVYAAVGDRDRAFSWLARAFDQHAAGRTMIAVDPRLDQLRSDPRFKSLLDRMKLPVITSF